MDAARRHARKPINRCLPIADLHIMYQVINLQQRRLRQRVSLAVLICPATPASTLGVRRPEGRQLKQDHTLVR